LLPRCRPGDGAHGDGNSPEAFDTLTADCISSRSYLDFRLALD
jgi:hypothetical protein